ncbi:MAG: CemA protein [Snowella sp.]|nr:CemA protein [Snowella sp.]
MASPVWLNRANQWVNQRSLKALENAYQQAKVIKSIEEKHFEGQKISPDSDRGQSVYDYFKSSLDRELAQIRLNLTQFRFGNFFTVTVASELNLENKQEQEILNKLNFIESVIGKYRQNPDDLLTSKLEITTPAPNLSSKSPDPPLSRLPESLSPNIKDTSSFLRLNRELTEEYEQQVIQQLRNLRQERKIAIRFLILLIVVPLSVQVLTKNLVYSPLINYFMVDDKKIDQMKISEEIVEEKFEEFARYKEILEIREILGLDEALTAQEKQERLKKKAQELVTEAAEKNQNGFKNLLADLTSLATFTVLVAVFRQEFKIVRQYLNRIFLGLNDVAKVFIFILLTDMFVGFHSAEGWEVILESFFSHFGLPENRQFIYIFIATVPVILDSFFKLLIFNYFTRKSPSAVAILEKMQQ